MRQSVQKESRVGFDIAQPKGFENLTHRTDVTVLLSPIHEFYMQFLSFPFQKSVIIILMENIFGIDKDYETERHRSSSEEIAFNDAVVHGNLEAVKKNCEAKRFSETDGVGRLSRDEVLNLKYHFVITCAVVTRACIEGGMIEEQGFCMSDYYIQQLDDIHSTADVEKLHDTMVIDFTTKMRITNIQFQTSKPIYNALNYIYIHRNESISVDDVAKFVGVSSSYLSRLFKKEVGVSVSDYVRQKKIETATNLLKFSPYSMVDIANRLSFSSQSHFIQTFKKIIGMTPFKYREKYGKSEWNVNNDSQSWL